MIEKKYSDKMQDSFQERLRKRVESRDENRVLLSHFDRPGYYYATGLNFGQLFRSPNTSSVTDAFREVVDNNEGSFDRSILFFSRPQDLIYVMLSDAYYVDEGSPVFLAWTDVGSIQVVRFDDLREAAENVWERLGKMI